MLLSWKGWSCGKATKRVRSTSNYRGKLKRMRIGMRKSMPSTWREPKYTWSRKLIGNSRNLPVQPKCLSSSITPISDTFENCWGYWIIKWWISWWSIPSYHHSICKPLTPCTCITQPYFITPTLLLLALLPTCTIGFSPTTWNPPTIHQNTWYYELKLELYE